MTNILKRHRLFVYQILISLIVTFPAVAGETDASKIIPDTALTLPAVGTSYTDPAFGTQTVRIGQNMRPEYSQLQAWNADMSLLLVNSLQIIDVKTYKVLHTVDYKWPAWGNALRWSPTDPLTLYYLGGDFPGCLGAAFMKYKLTSGATMLGQPILVKCFPEYEKFLKDESFEELSDDGRYVALLARKPTSSNSFGWVAEAFVYDIQADVKHKALELPVDATWGPRTCDHIQVSPSGKYALLQCAGGTARFYGFEAFDLEMNYIGKVHTGNAHGDVGRDANGNDVAVIDNANNAYLLTDKHYIVMAKIPQGVIFNGSGNVDASATLSGSATVPLLELDWKHNMHISCRNSKTPGFCVVSTYSAQDGFNNGWQTFEDEVFKLYIDSRNTSAHVERLAHHRSRFSAFSGQDICAPYTEYWAQPHATVSPDGNNILFGSNWKRICDEGDPVDAFVLTLSGIIKDLKAPAAPKNLTVK